MAFESTETFYRVSGDTIQSGPSPRPSGFGDGSPDSTLASAGWYRLWVDDGGAQPDRFHVKQLGPLVVDMPGQRVTRADTWVEHSPETKRAILRGEIDIQVFNPTGRQLVEDALAERDTETTSGGASERKSDLEDTDDADLNAFDSAIIRTPADGTGFVEAKMTSFIDIVDPWAGEPQNIYALRVALRIIRDGDPAAGASARAHMFGPRDGPAGAVMSFTQDGSDPAVWWSQSQQGRYWDDPATQASMRLLWYSGSIAVAETKLLDGYGDRQSAIVRAGLP